jgi:16S rRNA (cytosine1402-N4)-methyltransferase
MNESNTPHISVLQSEVLSCFKDQNMRLFFEGTLGAGGHARAILEAHPEIERYIACDRDPEALASAADNLAPWRDKVELIHGDFAQLDDYLNERDISSVDGFFLISECHLCS